MIASLIQSTNLLGTKSKPLRKKDNNMASATTGAGMVTSMSSGSLSMYNNYGNNNNMNSYSSNDHYPQAKSSAPSRRASVMMKQFSYEHNDEISGGDMNDFQEAMFVNGVANATSYDAFSGPSMDPSLGQSIHDPEHEETIQSLCDFEVRVYMIKNDYIYIYIYLFKVFVFLYCRMDFHYSWID
jgi:hypothetical protein